MIQLQTLVVSSVTAGVECWINLQCHEHVLYGLGDGPRRGFAIDGAELKNRLRTREAEWHTNN